MPDRVFRLGCAWLLVAGCVPQGQPRPPPSASFYYPAGLGFFGLTGTDGTLYVASANFDRRFDSGSLIALDLSRVGLPPIGTNPGATGPTQIVDLQVGPNGTRWIRSLAGEIATFPVAGGVRLFIPSRAENNLLHVIDAAQDTLSCHFDAAAVDCAASSPSLGSDVPVAGVPRALQPIGVGISKDGALFVAHAQPDVPLNTSNAISYLVSLDATVPANPVTADRFIVLGNQIGGTHGIAVGSRYAFATGRYNNQAVPLLRLVDRQGQVQPQFPGVEGAFRAFEARGIALSSDERRLFVVTRTPDMLLSIDVANSTSPAPTLSVIRAVPLPEGPNELKLIERAGRGPLVVVASSIAGMVEVYDDEVGDLVAEVSGVGMQPFGLAVDLRQSSARIYASCFGDGRIAVIDLPDLNRPEDLRLVAHLGRPQRCVVDPSDPTCPR